MGLRRSVIALVALLGLTCRDRSLTGPGVPREARLALAPSYSIVVGGPSITLARVRVTLGNYPTGLPIALDTVANFPPGGAPVDLDLTLLLTQASQRFVVRIAGIDAAGDTLFRSTDTVTVQQGTMAPTPVPLALTYAGPDTVVQSLSIGPRDTTIGVGDTIVLGAVARRADESVVSGALVGWTTRADTSEITLGRNTDGWRAGGRCWARG